MSKKTSKRERVGESVVIIRRGRRWYAQFMSGGKQVRRALHTGSVRIARQLALDMDYELRRGSLEAAPDPATSELISQYLSFLCNEGRRPSTVKRYSPVLQRLAELCRMRGVAKASRIDVLLVEAFRERRLEEGASERTRYQETMIIKQLLKYAEQRNLIPVNRLKGMRVLKPRSPMQACYTLDEVNRILEASKPELRTAFAFLAFTGMRVGELRYVTWHDVDFSSGVVHVRAKDDWRPKNGKDRIVPMHPRVWDALGALPKSHRWVLTARASAKYPHGDHQISAVHLLEKLKRILRRLKIGEGGLHTFRHFFITHCANQGVPPTVVMKWVGHSDLRMIMRYYELQDDESKRAMGSVDFGAKRNRFRTKIGQSGGEAKQPRSQPPVFQVVTSAS